MEHKRSELVVDIRIPYCIRQEPYCKGLQL